MRNTGDNPTDEAAHEGHAQDDALLADPLTSFDRVARIYGIQSWRVRAGIPIALEVGTRTVPEAVSLSLRACGYSSLDHEPVISQLATRFVREMA